MTLLGKLLKDGINAGGRKVDRHIKITVGLRHSIPGSIRLCETQSDVSEDIALAKAINGIQAFGSNEIPPISIAQIASQHPQMTVLLELLASKPFFDMKPHRSWFSPVSDYTRRTT